MGEPIEPQSEVIDSAAADGAAPTGLSRRLLRLIAPRFVHRAIARPVVTVDGSIAPPLPSDVLVAEEATPAQARGMRMFWWDGFFAFGAETIYVQLIVAFALFVGASTFRVGVLSSVENAVAAFALFAGARAAEMFARRKKSLVTIVGFISRFPLLLLALIPFLDRGSPAFLLVVLLAAGRAFFINLHIPAWTALVPEIVPLGLRARFLSLRNIGKDLGGLLALAAVLLLLPQAGHELRLGTANTWHAIWLFAFAMGVGATMAWARIPSSVERGTPAARAAELPPMSSMLHDRNFMTYCGAMLVWNTALWLAAPFFTVYLLKNLGGNLQWVAAGAVCIVVFDVVGQTVFGRYLDVRRCKQILVFCALTIPATPLAWFFINAPWQMLIINVVGGTLWAGFLLANFNLLYNLAPEAQRARYGAVQLAVVFLPAALAPILGGLIAQAYGIRLLFLLSAIGRFSAALLIARFVREEAAGTIRSANGT